MEEFEHNLNRQVFDGLYKIVMAWEDPKRLYRSQVAILQQAIDTGRTYHKILTEAKIERRVRKERRRVRGMIDDLTHIRTDPGLEIIPDSSLEKEIE
ncbi:hypothetical protein KY343_05495 [Candidatus Woesearchaeota archaeon]|nr:hypothetical protein [Candidatus Woesearchaeota archaeon]